MTALSSSGVTVTSWRSGSTLKGSRPARSTMPSQQALASFLSSSSRASWTSRSIAGLALDRKRARISRYHAGSPAGLPDWPFFHGTRFDRFPFQPLPFFSASFTAHLDQDSATPPYFATGPALDGTASVPVAAS